VEWVHYEKVKLNKTGFIDINSPEGATACSPVALAPGCDASRFASPEGATDIFVDDLVLSPLRGWENGERRKPGAKATRLHALAPLLRFNPSDNLRFNIRDIVPSPLLLQK